jgi:hypothetical protein
MPQTSERPDHPTDSRRGSTPARAVVWGLALALAVAPACKKRVEEHPAPKIAGKLLTGAEVRSALAGNTTQGTWIDGTVAFCGVLNPDGTATTKFGKTVAEARVATGTSVVQSTWRVTDDGLLCLHSVKVGSDAVNTPEACQRLARNGDKIEWYDAELRLAATSTVEPGKPEGF